MAANQIELVAEDCLLKSSLNPASVVYELIGAALLLYQLTRQYDIWKEDIENLQELAGDYEEIGTKYKTARLALRARDQEVYDYQNSRPSYPGPCYEHVAQARINSLIEIDRQHFQAIKALPAWACGDRNNVNYEAAKTEIRTGIHSMAESENYEQNQVDRYEEMRITAIARSTGGAVPNVSGAFGTVSNIARDSVSRSTASLNSAFGSFGNVVGSINNKYFSNERSSRVSSSKTINNTSINSGTILTSPGFEQERSNRTNAVASIENSSTTALSSFTV